VHHAPPVPLSSLLLLPLLLLALLPQAAHAQRSLAPLSPSGQSVTPVFEGWYKNPDGTYSISFGYYNRNATERLDIPAGDENFVSPGVPNQGQPANFAPRRHYGVFAVVVPADFGEKKVTWTLKDRGQTFAISGSLREEWQIDALEGEASEDNTPPALRFPGSTTDARGPLGATVGPLTVAVGAPLALTVNVTDDGHTRIAGPNGTRVGYPVTLTWFKHQGPGDVAFTPDNSRLTAEGGVGKTSATFTKAGDYIVRVRANDSAVASAGHSQCCWTNGFIKVTVTP